MGDGERNRPLLRDQWFDKGGRECVCVCVRLCAGVCVSVCI